jgi:hypothetical protein
LERGDTVWERFVDYFDRRTGEFRAYENGRLARKPKGPLDWQGYQEVHDLWLRGALHERRFAGGLAGDAALPREQRTLLEHMESPQVDSNVGVHKDGLENTVYPDQFTFDSARLGKGLPPEGDVYSCKARNFEGWTQVEVEAQVRADFKELKFKYGGEFELRRRGHPFFGKQVKIKDMYLVYDRQWVGDYGKYLESLSKELGVKILVR